MCICIVKQWGYQGFELILTIH